MARPVEYDHDAIIAAGDALNASGTRITGFALRQQLGGGNPTRLRQVWDEHVAGDAQTEAEVIEELPIEVAEALEGAGRALADRLSALVRDINTRAVRGAEQRVQEMRHIAATQAEAAQKEMVDAETAVEHAEAERDQTRAEAEALKKSLAQVNAELQSKEIELAQIAERHSAAEKTAYMAEQRASDSARQVESLTGQVAAEKARAEALSDHLKTAQEATADQRERVEAAEQRAKEAEDRSRAAIEQAGELRAEIAAFRAKLEAAEAVAVAAKAREAETKAELQGQVDALHAELAALRPIPESPEADASEKKPTRRRTTKAAPTGARPDA